MAKIDEYEQTLRAQEDWQPFLLEKSGLPGPRGNIELAMAFSRVGSLPDFQKLLAENPPDLAPVNSPREFLAFCGAVGLGRCLAAGDMQQIKPLRALANDPRWRTREAVCMALQQWGDVNMDALVEEMKAWAGGSLLEQRAAAAAICEPRLLKEDHQAEPVLGILERITAAIATCEQRKTDDFSALRKGLAYCWSVAIAAYPQQGKPVFEKWLNHHDKDVRWILKQNLSKNRLVKMDANWVAKCARSLEEGSNLG